MEKLLDMLKKRPWVTGGVSAAVVVAIVISLVLSGGGGDEPSSPGTSDSTQPTETSVVVPQVGELPVDAGSDTDDPSPADPVDSNPLTGEPLDGPSSSQIIAVKVDNGPNGRPQIGLDAAQMVIEIPVEGGFTRFTAMFFETWPGLVGPVRSLRPVDTDVVAPFDALLVTTGGQDFVYRELEGAGIETADQGDSNIFQSLERPIPSHLMATMDSVADLSRGSVPDSPPLQFGSDWSGVDAAETVRIPFSSVADVEYRFEGDRYRRYENGQVFEVLPTFDGSLSPLEADTVIVQFVAERWAGYNDSTGAAVPTFDVIGFGRVLVFHDGTVVEGQWLRAAQNDGTVFVDSAGEPLLIPQGVVMWAMVPRSLDVSFE